MYSIHCIQCIKQFRKSHYICKHGIIEVCSLIHVGTLETVQVAQLEKLKLKMFAFAVDQWDDVRSPGTVVRVQSLREVKLSHQPWLKITTNQSSMRIKKVKILFLTFFISFYHLSFLISIPLA